MPGVLPQLIFTDHHRNPITGRVLEKLVPKLKAMGYADFLEEAPENQSLADHIRFLEDTNNKLLDANNSTESKLHTSTEILKLHSAQTSYKQFLTSLNQAGMNYTAVDNEVMSDPTLTESEIISLTKFRDAFMADRYLNMSKSKSFFARIGLGHALGTQKHIVHEMGMIKASQQFCYFNVYTKDSLTHNGCYQQSVLQAKIKFPLNMIFIDATSMTDDEVVDKIIQQVHFKIKQNKLYDSITKGQLKPFTQPDSSTKEKLKPLIQADSSTKEKLKPLAQADSSTKEKLKPLAQADSSTKEKLKPLAQADSSTKTKLKPLKQCFVFRNEMEKNKNVCDQNKSPRVKLDSIPIIKNPNHFFSDIDKTRNMSNKQNAGLIDLPKDDSVKLDCRNKKVFRLEPLQLPNRRACVSSPF